MTLLPIKNTCVTAIFADLITCFSGTMKVSNSRQSGYYDNDSNYKYILHSCRAIHPLHNKQHHNHHLCLFVCCWVNLACRIDHPQRLTVITLIHLKYKIDIPALNRGEMIYHSPLKDVTSTCKELKCAWKHIESFFVAVADRGMIE